MSHHASFIKYRHSTVGHFIYNCVFMAHNLFLHSNLNLIFHIKKVFAMLKKITTEMKGIIFAKVLSLIPGMHIYIFSMA